jgi:hypothetical protein
VSLGFGDHVFDAANGFGSTVFHKKLEERAMRGFFIIFV